MVLRSVFQQLHDRASASVHAVVTEVPSGVCKDLDDDFALLASIWNEVRRVLLPGGYLACITTTDTDLVSMAIRLGGFEIRDTLLYWHAGGFQPVILARAPLAGTVAQNVLTHGVGALNVNECRIATTDNLNGGAYAKNGTDRYDGYENWRFKRTRGRSALPGDDRTPVAAGMFAAGAATGIDFIQPSGRWPANLIHDGSEGIEALFAAHETPQGSPARYFHVAPDKQALFDYLTRLILPEGGMLLDPFTNESGG